jgi:hypothetical protein
MAPNAPEHTGSRNSLCTLNTVTTLAIKSLSKMIVLISTATRLQAYITLLLAPATKLVRLTFTLASDAFLAI